MTYTEVKIKLFERGRLLRMIRINKNLSIYKLAQKSGLCRQTIMKIERGENHDMYSYIRLTDTLKRAKK